MLVFEERGNRSTRRKPLGAQYRTTKLNPHMTPDLGIEPRPHLWEARALTTAPSLHLSIPRTTTSLYSQMVYLIHFQCNMANLVPFLEIAIHY